MTWAAALVVTGAALFGLSSWWRGLSREVVLVGCSIGPAPVAEIAGSYGVSGLESSSHRPLVFLEEANAWSGALGGLPVRVVYEDGLAIAVDPAESAGFAITQGTVADPKEIVRCLERSGLGALPPQIEASHATDQPSVTIRYRVDHAWRSVTVIGLNPNGKVTGHDYDPFHPLSFDSLKIWFYLWRDRPPKPPLAFLGAQRALHDLALRDRQAFEQNDFRVTLTDTYPSEAGASTPWPDGIAPPPDGLKKNTDYMGNPRSYEIHGDAGRALAAFVEAQRGARVRTPSGDDVHIRVQTTIPDQEYIERVERCSPGSALPYYFECTE